MDNNIDTLEKLVKKAIWEGKSFLETFLIVSRDNEKEITMSEVSEVFNRYSMQMQNERRSYANN